MKTSAEKRQAEIMQLLAKNGMMSALDIAEYFQVSRETIRRDLIALSGQGLIKKNFGSVVPVHDFRIPPMKVRVSDGAEIKQRLCELALKEIPPHSVIFLDTGSTPFCMAQLLAREKGHTIITNSIPAAQALMGSGNELVLTGGSVNDQIACTLGMQTTEFLSSVKMDVAILGTAGFDQCAGPTSNHFADIQIKRLAVQNAATKLVLATSKKAQTSGLMQYAAWQEISAILTDDALPAGIAEKLKSQTRLLLVPNTESNIDK